MELPSLTEIERRRKALGLTQTELAGKAGVSQSLIARVEAGSVDPRYTKVSRIFRALEEFKDREVCARDIMSLEVVGVQKTVSMENASGKMKEYEVSQMPVYEGDAIVGSISERVILDQISRGVDTRQFSSSPVSDYMEAAFPTVGPETPLSVVSALLEYNTAVVVQEMGQTRGVITKADLLKVVHG